MSCTAAGSSTAHQDTTNLNQADISLANNGNVTCTFTNQAEGEITIVKHTNPRGIDQSFSYTSTIAGATNFGLNDKTGTSQAANDTKDITSVAPGQYTVTETAVTGWTLGSLSCTGNGPNGNTNTSTGVATIDLAAGGHVTCTYVNNQPTGAILITKTGKDVNCVSASTQINNGVCTGSRTADLNGATFSISGTDLVGNPVSKSATTATNGTACVTGLPWNGTAGKTFTVTETGNPTGYSKDPTSQDIAVTMNANCSDSTVANAATGTFTDTPLTNISVNASAQVTGATNSTITCKDSSQATVGAPVSSTTPDPANYSATGLVPGTYTCTVVVDP